MEDTQQLYYLAGFFDGEGSIGMYRRKSWTLQVTVSQKVEEPLELFDRRFPGAAWNYFERVTSLVWYDSRAFDLIETLQPYFIVKQRQAQLAHMYIDMSKARKPGTAWTPMEQSTIEQIAEEIKKMKHRDPQERGR